MRVVVAPDKFKGSLDAAGVAQALAQGVADVDPAAQCVLIPMADGGDGTVAAFLAAGAAARRVRVSGPLGEAVEATYARDGATAVIEMAAASGLTLGGERPDAVAATTRGTGELLRDALDGGATRIVLGIGGSATTDGGRGALEALGARFLPDRIDLGGLDARLRAVDLAIACDVDNPLLGPQGAATVYGPQKGARPAEVERLEAALAQLAAQMEAATGTRLRDLPGAGAAGGLGWGLASACGARMERGVTLVAQVRGLADALAGAGWCLTGEGSIDEQTLRGKVVSGVAEFADAAGVTTTAFGGRVDAQTESALRARGIACVPIVREPSTLAEALRDVRVNLRAAAARATLLRLGTR